jgi:hypothetical protein
LRHARAACPIHFQAPKVRNRGHESLPPLPSLLMGGGRSGMGSAERVILHASFQTTSHNDSIVIYRHRSESAAILIIAHGDIHVLTGNSNTTDYLSGRLYQVKARLTRK